MIVEHEGDPALHGAGFQRAVVSGRMKVVERLLAADPPNSFTYTLVDGAPVKEDYRGKAEFTAMGDSTQIKWSGEFTPKYPGTGWLVAYMTKWTVGKIIDAIEQTCCKSA